MRMKQQRGGTILGFIIGVVVGLAAALVVAVYVTKVPVPFVNKGQSRSADQDAAEAKKNKDWDPNAPLYGKNPAKPATAASATVDAAAKAASAATSSEPFTFYVQLGAYRTQEDAESQRAKLSLSGIETKITEREQSGRIVFRVRTGPFDTKDDAERNKEKLDKAGFETSLVRVQR